MSLNHRTNLDEFLFQRDDLGDGHSVSDDDLPPLTDEGSGGQHRRFLLDARSQQSGLGNNVLRNKTHTR